ncbi:ATP-binding cassette domain-containing protein [Nonomuraea sp. JJY05]|uniref:ATP-binding cassette domain-containing protein n=1 Tax=Nonomuraea sp. JJY05 TaxID=3350255 RepID=UPI00373E1914
MGDREPTTSSGPAQGGGCAPAASPVAEAAGIIKRFGSMVALDGARITIMPGETHALVGRNGAGKSTLVSILTGLQAPDEGTLTFGGSPPHDSPTATPGGGRWPVSTRNRRSSPS